jgi:glycosyltransferase involved in cell wall biosynthesis
LAAAERFMADFGTPMLALEQRLLEHSAGVHAISSAIAPDIEKAYGVSLRPPRLTVVPLGLEDWSGLPAAPPDALPEGAVRVLFAGRLEARKAIDVLLEAARTLLPGRKHVYLDVVGSDTLASDERRSCRAAFERDPSMAAIRDRVRFHGEVTDEVLRGFYRACDIFVAPSRYESFGLVLIEAMMFAKPVIGCRAGGMTDIVEVGKTGLLAEPGDGASLQACLECLIDDPELRRQMGAAGRRRYKERFAPDRMTDALVDVLLGSARSHVSSPGPSPATRHLAGGAGQRDRKARSPPAASGNLAASPTRAARVAVVCSIIARHDAVSAAVRQTFLALGRNRRFELSVLTARNDFADIPAHVVDGLGALLLHPAFLTADLVIYHFGIYNPLFDALIAADGRARQIVGFHNITPLELADPEQRPVIEASFRQLFNLRRADRIWCMSDVNAAELTSRGFDPRKLEIVPLAVERPPRTMLATKTAGQVELLFVGRIVTSKGGLDLIEAVDLVRRASDIPFRLRIVGNLEFSDPAYVARIKREIAERDLSCVQFIGTVDDDVLIALYRSAHILAIPSYHEGFGVPVIEALRSGCIPVGYAAHNVPHVAARLGRLVEVGDRSELAAAMIEVIAGVAKSAERPDVPLLPLDCGRMSRRAFDEAAGVHVARFSADRVGGDMRRSVAEVLDAPAKRLWSERHVPGHAANTLNQASE